MANEELTGILGGISSGLTESIGQRLQAEGLNIRSQRNAALSRELDLEEQLRLDKLPEQQAEFEQEQKMMKKEFELKQTEVADAQRAEAEKNELKTPVEYLTEELDPVPIQEEIYNQIALTYMREFMDADGKISRFDYKEFQKNVREGNVPGYLKSYKNMLSRGTKQADDLKEAEKIEVRKAEEKDPALTNPEYRKRNPKVAEADAAIAQLEEASNNYSVERRAVEEFEKKLEERKKKEAEQKKLNQERIAMIETIQRAREKAKTPSRIDLAIKAAQVPVNLNEMTPEDAVKVLAKLQEFGSRGIDEESFEMLMIRNRGKTFWDVTQSIVDKIPSFRKEKQNEFTDKDQESLNNVLNQ